MKATQGDVWWGPAPHKSDPAYRPWLVVSDDTHPFANEECIVVGMTTQGHADGIAVSNEAWIRGGSEQEAYVSPWYVTTIKHRDMENQQGEIAESLVTEAVEALHRYTPIQR